MFSSLPPPKSQHVGIKGRVRREQLDERRDNLELRDKRASLGIRDEGGEDI